MTRIRRSGDGVELSLTTDDAFLLRIFAELLVRFLAPEEEAAPADPLEAMVATSTEPVETPDDPAMRRLLPDAYGDAAAAGEFRRLMESDLRRQKVEALEAVLQAIAEPDETGVRVTLTADETETWLQAINDIRLFLGSRLEVTEDNQYDEIDTLDEDDPRLPQLYAYGWLGFFQESMLQAID
jgi:hypothetical protein